MNSHNLNHFAFIVQKLYIFNFRYLSVYGAGLKDTIFVLTLFVFNVNKCAFPELYLLKYQPSSFIVIDIVLLKISNVCLFHC